MDMMDILFAQQTSGGGGGGGKNEQPYVSVIEITEIQASENAIDAHVVVE